MVKPIPVIYQDEDSNIQVQEAQNLNNLYKFFEFTLTLIVYI